MRRGIPIRRSRAAGWARIFGGLAVPVLLLCVAGVRLGFVPPDALQPVLVAGFALGVAALGLACYALADIWVTGAGGARSAFIAVLYAAPALFFLAIIAAAAILYPRMNDIATNLNDPPLFFADGAPLAIPNSAVRQAQRRAYPDVVPHLYPAPLKDVYEAARKVVETQGWIVSRDVRPPPPTAPPIEPAGPSDEDAARLDAMVVEEIAGPAAPGPPLEQEAPAVPPVVWRAPVPDNVFGALPVEEAPDEAMIEAFARTPIFGFVDDVVVRLRSNSEGTQVDMRSASRSGEHDLGSNARRIRRFFADLDAVLHPESATAAR